MRFDTATPPHTERPPSVSGTMRWVIAALLPGALAMIWCFGWGVLINMALAGAAAIGFEALVMRLRGRPAGPAIGDLSALLTALLLGLALPPLLPWWLTLLGTFFAIVVVKQLFGGIGYNPFNPAMGAYVFLLISYPVEMTSWVPPLMLNSHPLGFADTLGAIFGTTPPPGLSWDALSGATPLDTLRGQLDLHMELEQIRQNPIWGSLGSRGWELAGLGYLLGGLLLLYKRVISWHIPVSLLASLFLTASLLHLLAPEAHPPGLFHLFSGAALLGAFFIATDPVTATTTRRGQLIYGAGIGLLVYVIRTWGGYPDAIAFAVLLMNMAAPTIDYYTRPRVYGHQGGR